MQPPDASKPADAGGVPDANLHPENYAWQNVETGELTSATEPAPLVPATRLVKVEELVERLKKCAEHAGFGRANGEVSVLRSAAAALQSLTAEKATLTERAEAAERLRTRLHETMAIRAEAAQASLTAAQQTIERLTDRAELAEEALGRIVQWADAYPLDIFPEPDWVAARAMLGADVVSQISASNMRHAVEGVGKIARAVLSGEETK